MKGGHDGWRLGTREEWAGREHWRMVGKYIVEECGRIMGRTRGGGVYVSLNW